MLRIIQERLRQGHQTSTYPETAPRVSDRFRGRPIVDSARCEDGCRACAEACPTGAIEAEDGKLRLDLGKCLFCVDCTQACPTGAVRYQPEYRLAASRREDLILDGERPAVLAHELDERTRRLFGRSLKLRQVSAGGCNGCEADTNVLTTLVFDLGRFGIDFVASPRHADGLLITGPVTENMREALLLCYEAVPPPKLVIAVGACAIAGGPYIGHSLVASGADSILPVDLYVPGCPPHPWTILDGLLRLLGRLDGPTKDLAAPAQTP
jgi:Ni,Fe-hydrogenase III small subunit/ferredoxin